MQLQLDNNKKELKSHGTYAFPVNVSYEQLSRYERKSFLWHWHKEIELSRKDVFQDSVIHYLLIYQVLAAEDIQCNDQHICHHHQQIAVFIHENI